MGRSSVKKDKNLFQNAREKRGLTREAASALFEEAGWQGISPERIERIESGKIENPDPYDVLAMSEIYRDPALCNIYCTEMCEIGRRYGRKAQPGELSGHVLTVLSLLDELDGQKDRLISISADGTVDDSEIADFVRIEDGLARISDAVGSLQLWTERMLLEGTIDKKKYDAVRAKIKSGK